MAAAGVRTGRTMTFLQEVRCVVRRMGSALLQVTA